MASLLSSLFGGGQQDQQQAPPQGPQGPQGLLGRMTASYNEPLYQAQQQAQQQQAVYQAALKTPGISPEIAQAMAMSPQFFQAQQGAYLPQATQVTPVQNADGSTTLLQHSNPGGGAGHGGSVSGIPITEPPGTTASPAGAAGAAPAPQEAGQTGNAPATAQGPKNTLQGMPGSVAAMEAQVKTNIAAGQDPTAGLPDNYKNAVNAVRAGRMTLSEIKQTRNEHIAGTVRNILLTIDPDFNELKNEKTANYVKSYMDTKTGDVGMSRNALGTSLGHISDAIDNQVGLKNRDANVAAGASIANRVRGMFGEQAPKVAQQNLQIGTAADELAKFITGKPPTDASRGQYREAFPTPYDTPRVAAAKYNAMADLLEKRMTDMEVERDANFSGKNVAKDYPIVLPQHREVIANIRKKAAQLQEAGNYQIQTEPGAEAPPAAAGGGMPSGWKYVK